MGLYTQQDPSGIAGGLNLYGYANGDPINFSDPFGLCPPEDDEDDECPGLLEAIGTLLQNPAAVLTLAYAMWQQRDFDFSAGTSVTLRAPGASVTAGPDDLATGTDGDVGVEVDIPGYGANVSGNISLWRAPEGDREFSLNLNTFTRNTGLSVGLACCSWPYGITPTGASINIGPGTPSLPVSLTAPVAR